MNSPRPQTRPGGENAQVTRSAGARATTKDAIPFAATVTTPGDAPEPRQYGRSLTPRELLVVVERRDFPRGCWAWWLRGFCQEFEVTAVANLEERFRLEKAAAIIIGVDRPAQRDGWVDLQVSRSRAGRSDLPILLILDEGDVTDIDAESQQCRSHVQGVISASGSMKLAAAALRLVIAGGRYFPERPARADPDAPPFPQTLAGLLRRRRDADAAANLSPGAGKVQMHDATGKLHGRNRSRSVSAARSRRSRDVPLELATLKMQAEAFRRLASGIIDGEFRTSLLHLAVEYERRLVETAERLARYLEQHGFVVVEGTRNARSTSG